MNKFDTLIEGVLNESAADVAKIIKLIDKYDIWNELYLIDQDLEDYAEDVDGDKKKIAKKLSGYEDVDSIQNILDNQDLKPKK